MAEDPISDYLRNIGRVPLLTPAEEIQLGHTVQKLMALLEANPDGPYTREERKLIRRGQRAKDRMINANLRLMIPSPNVDLSLQLERPPSRQRNLPMHLNS